MNHHWKSVSVQLICMFYDCGRKSDIWTAGRSLNKKFTGTHYFSVYWHLSTFRDWLLQESQPWMTWGAFCSSSVRNDFSDGINFLQHVSVAFVLPLVVCGCTALDDSHSSLKGQLDIHMKVTKNGEVCSDVWNEAPIWPYTLSVIVLYSGVQLQ